MHLLTGFIGVVLVAATFGKVFPRWPEADDDTASFEIPEGAVNVHDILQNVDLTTLVKEFHEGKTGESLQSVDVSYDVSSSLDDVENSLEAGACACKGHACACCFTLTYTASGKTYRVTVCGAVAWASTKFYFRMTFNKVLVYHAYVYRSLVVCRRFPYSAAYWACVEMHNVNLSRKSFCLTLADISTKIRIHVNRCFRFVGDNGVTFPASDLLGTRLVELPSQ